ncbi:MAG TPA: polysaccharide deacetylase family protein [Acidimicrobiia bacterium]|nr:polysaccharide deacetylase family protein [Acidimicrobiia bacterium]
MGSRTPRSIVGRAVGVVRGAGAMAGWRPRPRGASVLTYHDVTDDPANPTEQVTPAALRAQLIAAVHWGVCFVPLPDLCERVLRGEPVDGLGAITFDDALVGVYRSAVGVLSELGLPATVFVVSDRLGAEEPAWYPGSDRVMTMDELRELAAAGVDVQSHTRTHADLPSLTGADLDRELAGSRAALSDLLGRDIDYLAYPFGHYDHHVCRAARDAGYRGAFTFRNGRVAPGLDPYRLPRMPMWTDAKSFRLAYNIARPTWSFPENQVDSVTRDSTFEGS